MAIDSLFMNPNSAASSTAIKGKDPSGMGMNEFMNLLAAQMSNQDMMNPVSDTEFVAQMAQFSALQGIQTIQEYQLSSYASSYAGKYVTIANQNQLGDLETVNGKVDSVTFFDGKPKVVVNGTAYDLHTVMAVSSTSTADTITEAAGYIGKTVTVTWTDEFGEAQERTGQVTSVTMKDNEPYIILDGKEYALSAIKTVNGKGEATPA